MKTIKLRRLWAVLAVYETGSAIKAATHIHMSQPAVTSAVTLCEHDFGALLFERLPRGMSPTREGRALCRRLAVAVHHLREAETALQSKKGGALVPLHRLAGEVQLNALSAVVETGSFSQAARRLGLSQPSVHRACRELETLCGTVLWRRDGPRIDVTAEARILARQADLCFGEIRAAFDDIQDLRGFAGGRLNIGTLPLARAKWLPDALARTLRAYPDAQVQIIDGPYDEQLNALLHARIDFILGAVRVPSPSPEILQQTIFQDPLVILVRAGHPFASSFDSDHDKLTPDQLGSLSWILPRKGTPGRENFEAFIAAKNLPPPLRVVECSSLVVTRALLLKSDHAALLSRHQVEDELALGQLKIMGPPLTGSTRAIGITTRKNFRPTKLEADFVDNLVSTEGKPESQIARVTQPANGFLSEEAIVVRRV